MATTRTINVNVDSKSAVKNLEEINAALGAIAEGSQKTNQQLDQITKQNEANANATSGALNKIAKGFTGIGLAMKAAGIGLIVSTFNFLKDALMKNEKVANAVNAVLGTLSSLVGQVVTAVTNAYDKVSSLTNGFEHTKAVIGDLLTIALTPLKFTFFELQLAIKAIQLAWEKSIFGKKDEGRIKELQADILSLSNKLVDTGKKAIDAGKDIAANAGGMLDEVTKFGTAVVNNVSKISVKATYDAAKALEQMKGNTLVSIATLEKQIGALENKAKDFETIRDKETVSVSERIKAGEDLIKILEEEAVKVKAKADATVQLASLEYKLNKTKENQAALIKATADATQAETDAKDKLKSANEQLIAVQTTANDIAKLESESVQRRQKEYQDFTNSRIKDEKLRLQVQKDVLDEQEASEIAALEATRARYNEGTQAFAEAEQAILDKKQEYAIKRGTIEDQITDYNKTKAIEATQNQLAILQAGEDNEKLSIQRRIEYNNQAQQEILKGTYATEAERTKALEENNKARMALDEAETAAKMSQLNAVAGILDQGVELLGENTAAGKALGIASALINTYTGITAALANPFPMNIIASVATGLAGFSAIKKIIAVKVPGKGGAGATAGATSAPGAATPSAPAQFNVVGTSSTNMLAQSISAQQNKPIKAYVVSKDVTTAQSLDRNAVNTATFK